MLQGMVEHDGGIEGGALGFWLSGIRFVMELAWLDLTVESIRN